MTCELNIVAFSGESIIVEVVNNDLDMPAARRFYFVGHQDGVVFSLDPRDAEFYDAHGTFTPHGIGSVAMAMTLEEAEADMKAWQERIEWTI